MEIPDESEQRVVVVEARGEDTGKEGEGDEIDAVLVRDNVERKDIWETGHTTAVVTVQGMANKFISLPARIVVIEVSHFRL